MATRRNKDASPLTKTMAFWRAAGYHVGEVTRRLPIPGAHVTQDLFGFLDAYGFRLGSQDVGLQACARGAIAAHVEKIRGLPVARDWSVAHRIVVMGWAGVSYRMVEMVWQTEEVSWSCTEATGTFDRKAARP
jgi:hypothetical protein